MVLNRPDRRCRFRDDFIDLCGRFAHDPSRLTEDLQCLCRISRHQFAQRLCLLQIEFVNAVGKRRALENHRHTGSLLEVP